MRNTRVNFDIKSIGIFRKATSRDITDGNTVFLVGDGDELHRMIVEEVLQPNDPYKAFMFDGCRYGLDGLYVLLSNSELHSEINRLSDKLASIYEISFNERL